MIIVSTLSWNASPLVSLSNSFDFFAFSSSFCFHLYYSFSPLSHVSSLSILLSPLRLSDRARPLQSGDRLRIQYLAQDRAMKIWLEGGDRALTLPWEPEANFFLAYRDAPGGAARLY